ncbi:MAG: hypothetical protein JWM10_260, partial [Myxococcaceae bacterium]|nr:hypothetical protein [Myxococcaceae bacterium]
MEVFLSLGRALVALLAAGVALAARRLATAVGRAREDEAP